MISPLRALFFCALFITPGMALAHSPIQGINNFFNGVLHPLFVPSHLLLLVAVGLFLGQRGIRQNFPAIGAFVAATISGLIAAWFSIGGDIEIFLLAGGAFVGLLVVANIPARPAWCMLIAAITGFALAMDSAQETLAGTEKLLALFGSGVGIYLLLLYPMALADYFGHKAWQKIGVRIIGSWIAASCLLVLAVSLPGKMFTG